MSGLSACCRSRAPCCLGACPARPPAGQRDTLRNAHLPARRAAFAPPPPSAFRVPDLSSGAEPSFASPSTTLPAAPRASGSGGLFSLEPYKVYFDVDTADVLHRVRLACLPLGSTFTTAVQDNPDLCARFAAAWNGLS